MSYSFKKTSSSTKHIRKRSLPVNTHGSASTSLVPKFLKRSTGSLFGGRTDSFSPQRPLLRLISISSFPITVNTFEGLHLESSVEVPSWECYFEGVLSHFPVSLNCLKQIEFYKDAFENRRKMFKMVIRFLFAVYCYTSFYRCMRPF